MAEKPRKLRVGVVFGGRSGEHEVSLAGAASVMAAMDQTRFELVPIGIAKDGRWLMGGDPLRALAGEAAQLALASGDPDAHTKHELLERAAAQATGASLMRMETSEGLPPGLRDRLDVVLVLLHGPQGEDGTVQGLLQLAGVPYTGAGVLASAVGMDKVAMKDLFRAHGLPIVEYAVVRRHDWEREPAAIARGIATEIGFPCFVKPANLGSSVGISKVKAAEDLPAAIDLAATHDRRIIVERAIQAREVEVAVLGNDEPRVSVPGEVCFAGEWYDYDTKYGAGQTTFKVPAPLAARGHGGDPLAGPARLPRHRLRGHGARGLLRRGRPARARERDQHDPRLHRVQRLPAPLGSLGHPLPRPDRPPDRPGPRAPVKRPRAPEPA